MIFPEKNTAFVIITTAVPCPALIRPDFGPLYVLWVHVQHAGVLEWALSSDHFLTLGPTCPWGVTKTRLIDFSVFCFPKCQVMDSEVEKRPWLAGHWVWGHKLTDTEKARERWARSGEEWACRVLGGGLGSEGHERQGGLPEGESVWGWEI